MGLNMDSTLIGGVNLHPINGVVMLKLHHKATERSICIRPKGLPNHSEFYSLGMNLGRETGWWRSGLNISVLELL